MSSGKRRSSASIIIDVVLVALLIAQMLYQYQGQTAHTWMGIFLTVAVVLHVFANRHVLANMMQRPRMLMKVLAIVVDILTEIVLLLALVSGLAMSGFFPLVGTSVMRAIHLWATFASVVVIGVHAGMHAYRKTIRMPLGIKVVLVVWGLYGLLAFFALGYPSYLSMQVMFANLSTSAPVFMATFDQLSVFVCFGCIGTALSWCALRLSRSA